MTVLWWALITLTAVALIFVSYPFFRSLRPSGGDGVAARANVQLFQEHLAELQQQQQRGEISAEQLAALELELQRGLLNESDTESSAPVHIRRATGNWLLWSLLIAVPAVAFVSYKQLGASDDIAIIELLEQSSKLRQSGNTDTGKLQRELLTRIDERLQDNPDNFYYWVLTARLRSDLENYPGALEAYRRAEQLSPKDVTLLQEYLQTAFLVAGGKPTAEMRDLVNRILAISPNNYPVLGLSGRLAFEGGDYQRAITHWNRVLAALPPEQETARIITREVERARQRLGPEAVARLQAAAVKLRVSLAAGLAVHEGDTLFVIARRPGQTSGAPLAVKRLTAGQLPAEIILDDSNLMLPGSSFADLTQVTLMARVSRSGSVKAQAGDLQGQLDAVAVGGDTVTDLVIDKAVE